MASMLEALKSVYNVQEEKKIEEAIEPAPKGKEDEYDGEGDMALNQLETASDAIEDLMDMIKKNDNLPEWVQSKLTKAVDYLDSVRDYLAGEMDDEDEDEEEDDDEEMEEQAPVAPTLDRKYIKGTPEYKAYKATKKPINGMPTNNVKEEKEEEEVEEGTYHDSGWKKSTGQRKDSYGNVIKNIAKHLAKKGAAESDPNRKLRSDEKRVNGQIKREEIEEATSTKQQVEQGIDIDEASDQGYWQVVYKDKNGKAEGEKTFKDETSAKKYAARGNAVDRVGGKYHVFHVKGSMEEALTDKQKQLDVDKDGDIEADDLAKLRSRKNKKSEEKTDKTSGPSGKKEPIEMDPKLTEMSDAQMKKREEIVKSMKDKAQYFKDKYGDRWREVMYATATKMAMKD